jgi:hypothetical protein
LNDFTSTTSFESNNKWILVLLVVAKRFQQCQKQFKEISTLLVTIQEILVMLIVANIFQLCKQHQEISILLVITKKLNILRAPPRVFNFSSNSKKIQQLC